LLAVLTGLVGPALRLDADAPPATPAAAGDPADPPQGVFSDTWYAVRIKGAKAGYMHSVMRREGDIVVSKNETVIKVGRSGLPLTITMHQASRETVAGVPLAFDNEVNMAATKMGFHGTIDKGKLTLVSEQFGNQQTAVYDYDPRCKLSWGAVLEQNERGLEPGTRYRTFIYDPSLRLESPLPVDVHVEGKEVIDLFGRKTEATRVVQAMKVPSAGVVLKPDQPTNGLSITTTVWCDDQGIPLMTKANMMSIELEIIQCAEAYARSANEPPEMFINSLIKVDKRIDAAAARKITYHLEVRGEDGRLPDLPETGMQKVIRRDARSATLEVSRQDHRSLATAEPRTPPDDLADYLKDSLYLNHKDPKLREMAKAAAGDEMQPYKLADKLRKYVTENIREKNLSIGFATASEVARSREGDCTEHAVLLAALARANGLPARAVSGIIYVETFLGRQRVFSYHMWTQVYLGGQWVDLDAAQHQTDCDPTHIALNLLPLNDEGLADAALSLLNVIERLKIDTRRIE
jgi:hypothetical protein